MTRAPRWPAVAAGSALLALAWLSAGPGDGGIAPRRAGAAPSPAAPGGPGPAPPSVAEPTPPASATRAPAAPNTCLECHAQQEEERLVAPTRGFERDIHARRGLGCVACHGGDATDADITAMDPDKGYRGKPSREQIAELCASCHANAAYMKHFNPKPYVFSMAEFRTSVHCKKIAEGDTKVATCTNCHGVHGILPHRDPASPVNDRNVPATCAKCHNPEYMAGRTVPTNQFALYSHSVHGRALLEKEDTAAPACNDCHGNHGAVPPNTRDISLVCGNCHRREGDLFAKSKVGAILAGQGRRGCVTCHGNHDVQKPTDAMLAVGPGGTCGGCHEPGSAGERGAALIIERFHALKASLARTDSLLLLAEVKGMETAEARESWRAGQDELVGVRALLHSFDAGIVTTAIGEGDARADEAHARASVALRDWRNRRLGMGLSLVVILALMALLVAKIRRIESG